MDDRIEMIQLDLIEPHPANRRVGGFDQAKLEQLAESIKAVGVQQPAVVRLKPICNPETCTHLQGMDCEHNPGCCRKCGQHDCNSRCSNSGKVKYQLVAGERRWRASRIAGNDTLPCIVRELDDITALKIQTIENLQRDDVHPLDEADGYSQLIDRAGYTIDTIASEVGKSTSYIYQRLKLSSLIEEAKQLFVENKITAGHAILIARLGPDQQREIMKDRLFNYSKEVISVRNLDDYIHNHILLSMSQITWKMADSELLPEAGSCEDCPKRTGYQPELFADVCKDGKKKKDYCIDRTCFSKKQARIVELKREELKDEDILLVADSYVRNMPKNVVEPHTWTECKKKDPGAKKVLVAAGNQPGRVTYGKVVNNNYYSSQKSPEQKEQEKKERQKLKDAEDLRTAKVNAVLQAAEKQGSSLPLEAKRLFVREIWDHLGFDLAVVISKAEGWISKATEYHFGEEIDKRIKEMDVAQLNLLMLRIAMSNEIKFNAYQTPNTKTIDALMKVYNVKIKNKKERVIYESDQIETRKTG
ncbi:MAG: ParB/RepB/Spo0J family partition protein [Spirochaetes bacterium]|nr:ParB/RepB/Spo0J family partition protein [Spirochaetota bacterium]